MKMKCPDCKGFKGVFGYSPLGYPATLPCETCDATGEVPWIRYDEKGNKYED